MNYIIITVVFSVVILLLTTFRFKAPEGKKSGSGKESILDLGSLMNVVQQIVIVFLSAMLAMWLTEYAETKSTTEHVQAFIAPMQDTCISEFAGVSYEIKAIHDSDSDGTNEQLYHIVSEITKGGSMLFDTMIYNENFVATLDPLSYMVLNDDLESQRNIASELKEIDFDSMDRQEVAEQVARYLYHSTDAIMALEYLKQDVQFNLMNLTLVSDSVYSNNMYFEMYNNDIEMLEDVFSVDLSEWKNYRRYN